MFLLTSRGFSHFAPSESSWRVEIKFNFLAMILLFWANCLFPLKIWRELNVAKLLNIPKFSGNYFISNFHFATLSLAFTSPWDPAERHKSSWRNELIFLVFSWNYKRALKYYSHHNFVECFTSNFSNFTHMKNSRAQLWIIFRIPMGANFVLLSYFVAIYQHKLSKKEHQNTSDHTWNVYFPKKTLLVSDILTYAVS